MSPKLFVRFFCSSHIDPELSISKSRSIFHSAGTSIFSCSVVGSAASALVPLSSAPFDVDDDVHPATDAHIASPTHPVFMGQLPEQDFAILGGCWHKSIENICSGSRC